MTGEGFYYDLGSMLFWVLLGGGGTVAAVWLSMREKNKKKITQ